MQNTFKAGDWVVLKTDPKRKMKIEQVMGKELYRCTLVVDHVEQYLDFRGEELDLYVKR